MYATITSKGQITLPKALREQLHLSPGDRVEFMLGFIATGKRAHQHGIHGFSGPNEDATGVWPITNLGCR